MTRPYRQTRRADTRNTTRQRIVNAAIELHGTVGPARTTITAIAERAGTQRLTVYRHFPNERDLFIACTAQYQSQHPPPDVAAWKRISDPHERLRRALTEIYRYFGENEVMMANSLRDVESEPLLTEALGPMFAFFRQIPSILAAGWGARGRRRTRLMAALGHAIDFGTWRSLTRQQGLGDNDAVELMMGMVKGTLHVRA